MRIEFSYNIWNFGNKYPIGIPTNGWINGKNRGIMGAGLAKQAANRYGDAPILLGKHILTNGHVVGWIIPNKLISIPSKVDVFHYRKIEDEKFIVNHAKHLYKIPSDIPGFHIKSTIPFIQQSLNQLETFIDDNKLEKVYIVPLGCGHGELDLFDDFLPLIDNYSNKIICVISPIFINQVLEKKFAGDQ